MERIWPYPLYIPFRPYVMGMGFFKGYYLLATALSVVPSFEGQYYATYVYIRVHLDLIRNLSSSHLHNWVEIPYVAPCSC